MAKMSEQELDQARLRLHMVLMKHVGPEKKIGMGELYEEVFGMRWTHRINDTKALRKLITEMRTGGLPVLSDTSSTNGGYWIAASSSEINAYCDRLKARALKTLKRISSIQKVSLPEYIGQMALELEKGGN